MVKIDDEAYSAGKRAFKRGTTLRELVELSEPTEAQEKAEGFDHRAFENAHKSYCLGFGDALFAWLRGGMRK